METFLAPHPIFSSLPNLTFLTSGKQKFKFDKFLPCALFPTQNEPEKPKRSQINPHLHHETAVHILLEDAACRCFDLAHTDLAHLSPNCATHIKSHKNCIKMFENQNMNATTQTPKQYTTCHENTSFTKCLYFLKYEPIFTSIPQIFSPSKFKLLGLKNP